MFNRTTLTLLLLTNLFGVRQADVLVSPGILYLPAAILITFCALSITLWLITNREPRVINASWDALLTILIIPPLLLSVLSWIAEKIADLLLAQSSSRKT